MKISKKAQYGLRAMIYLTRNQAYRQAGKNKRAVSIRELSNTEGVPFEFLSKIFSDLEKAKLVRAKHGANGGYYLARPTKKINVKDVIDPLEDTTAVDCRLCGKAKGCLSKNVWRKVDFAIDKTLKSITLADLI